MEKRINTLSNMGLLSQFAVMLKDSQSSLFYFRWEYFRRILRHLMGTDVAKYKLLFDESLLKILVSLIFYDMQKTNLSYSR